MRRCGGFAIGQRATVSPRLRESFSATPLAHGAKSHQQVSSKKPQTKSSAEKESDDVVLPQPQKVATRAFDNQAIKARNKLNAGPPSHAASNSSDIASRVSFVVGMDEAGRGPICGPVVGAAVWISPKVREDLTIKPQPTKSNDDSPATKSSSPSDSGSSAKKSEEVAGVSIADSKKLTKATRLSAFRRLTGLGSPSELVRWFADARKAGFWSAEACSPSLGPAVACIPRVQEHNTQNSVAVAMERHGIFHMTPKEAMAHATTTELLTALKVTKPSTLVLSGATRISASGVSTPTSAADSEADIVWSMAIMNRTYIDGGNIFAATMDGMASAGFSVASRIPRKDQQGSCAQQPAAATPEEGRSDDIIGHRYANAFVPRGDEVVEQSSGGEGSQQQGDKSDVAAAARPPPYGSLHPDTLYLVDGKNVPIQVLPAGQGIIKGDQQSLAIAAASIVGKVGRDLVMDLLDKEYPEYGLAEHHGYGTRNHVKAMKEHGVIDQHRRSFKPVQHVLEGKTLRVWQRNRKSTKDRKALAAKKAKKAAAAAAKVTQKRNVATKSLKQTGKAKTGKVVKASKDAKSTSASKKASTSNSNAKKKAVKKTSTVAKKKKAGGPRKP